MNYYTGTHTCDLDTKGRVVVPKAFRKVPPEVLDGDLILSPSALGSWVEVYPESEWEAYIDRISAAENMEIGEAEELKERLFEEADRAKIDNQNRLALSHAQREELGIDGVNENVTLAFVGGGTHFKIYVAADYEREREQRRARKAELLQKFRQGPNRPGPGNGRGGSD